MLGEVHVGLARTLAALNRLDEAEDHLRRALAIDPASDDALDEFAALYLQGGRVGQALETMRRRLDARSDAQGHLVYAGLVLWPQLIVFVMPRMCHSASLWGNTA